MTKEENIQQIPLDRIKRDGGTQVRVQTCPSHIKTLESLIQEGVKLDPVEVFFDGAVYWPANGFHRCAAYYNQGVREIAAIVREGGRREALLHACGANDASAGKAFKPRSIADKKNAVLLVLRDRELRLLSEREISRRCGVSHTHVQNVRKQIELDEANRRKQTQDRTWARPSPQPEPVSLPQKQERPASARQDLRDRAQGLGLPSSPRAVLPEIPQSSDRGDPTAAKKVVPLRAISPYCGYSREQLEERLASTERLNAALEKNFAAAKADRDRFRQELCHLMLAIPLPEQGQSLLDRLKSQGAIVPKIEPVYFPDLKELFWRPVGEEPMPLQSLLVWLSSYSQKTS